METFPTVPYQLAPGINQKAVREENSDSPAFAHTESTWSLFTVYFGIFSLGCFVGCSV